jgi:primosomal protein N' (replication factor Y)
MQQHFTPLLLQQMKNAFERKEQVILFQNRRGFAPYVECKSCACVPKCKNCDVSLTYHKMINQLTCHYCGYTIPVPETCPACGNPTLQTKGFGTEKIEEEVLEFFPEARVARLDLDTARSRKSYEKIISDFENGKIDVLVGTQMISKGLDFERVRIVGILNADSLLNYPDFRSHERGFQLITQAAGRAGRRDKQGMVIIQTADPEQPIFRFITRNDYEGFYHSQLAERKLFKYPPFTRLISIVLKHKDEQKAEAGAVSLSHLLRQSLGNRVLGPNKPVIGRIQQQNIREILLKIDNQFPPTRVRELIKSAESRFRENVHFKQIVLYYNVDWA